MITHKRYAELEDLVFQHEIFRQVNDQEGVKEMERRMMLWVTPAMLIEMIGELESLECQVLEAKEQG